MTNHASVT